MLQKNYDKDRFSHDVAEVICNTSIKATDQGQYKIGLVRTCRFHQPLSCY